MFVTDPEPQRSAGLFKSLPSANWGLAGGCPY